MIGFLAAVEIDLDQKQAGFNARDIQCQHAGRMNVKGAAMFHKCIPDALCLSHAIQISYPRSPV